jgi:hypothetical protein
MNFKDGVLCTLHVGRWSGAKKLSASDLGLRPEGIPEFMRLGRKLLIPAEERNVFVQIEQNARNAMDRESFPFPVGGARFVPRKQILKVDQDLRGYKEGYQAAVVSFVERYQLIREEMLQRYSEHREKLEPFYPASHWVERSFSFNWIVFEIGETGIRQGETVEVYERFRHNLREQFEKFLGEAVIDLRYQVQETCGKLAQRVEQGEVVTQQGLQSIKNIIQKFENLNFVGDVRIETELNRLKENINGVSAKDLRENNALNALLGDIAQGVAREAADISDVSLVTGGYKRRLEM